MTKQICPKCGERVTNRDGFCRNCGGSLGPPPPVPFPIVKAGVALGVLVVVAVAGYFALRSPTPPHPPLTPPPATHIVTDAPPKPTETLPAPTEVVAPPTEATSSPTEASSAMLSPTEEPTVTPSPALPEEPTATPGPTLKPEEPTATPSPTKTPVRPSETPARPSPTKAIATRPPTSPPTPILRVRLLNYNDAPTCISMGISGINPAGWRLSVDGLKLAATFDGGGNARACGLGNGQEVTISILNGNGRVVHGGGGIPARGGAILTGVWR